MNLQDYIGESSQYDKKQQVEKRKPKSWLKSISSFANGQGGKLIFGVLEDNSVIGLEDFQKDSEDVSELIKVRIDPIPEFDLELIEMAGKVIITITVYPGRNTPYYVVDGGSKVGYTRVGNESVPVSSIQLTQLALRGQQKTYDELVTDVHVENAAFSKLKSLYYQRTRKTFQESDLDSFGLVTDKDFLTYTGALLADESLVRQSRIFCTRWNGLTKANGRMDALDDVELSGSLLIQLQDAEAFINRNSHKSWKKVGQYRVEYPDYPERAVAEAMVNAIIHRDYMELGSEIHVDMFDDRLEIYSPGGMVDGTKIQDKDVNLLSSKRRNPIIADVFSRMDLMERRGSGLRKILDSYTQLDNYSEKLAPEFHSNESEFIVILKNLNYSGDKVAITSGDKVAITSGDKKLQMNLILEFAQQNESFRTKDIEELLQIRSSRARKLISDLVTEGRLEALGENRNRRYQLIK